MAIRLLRLLEVPESPRDRVFRYSPTRAILPAVVVACASAGLVLVQRSGYWGKSTLAYFIAGAFLFGLFLVRRFVMARFQPSNWLAKLSDDGVFLQFRSYLNYRLPAEDPTVAFIPFQDIRSVRLVRERLKTLDNEGAASVRTRRIVEFELGIEPALLAPALATECARTAPKERRWYGTSSTLYKHYPVLMQTPPFLRVEWAVVPRAAAFLDALPPLVQVAPAAVLMEDFADLGGLTREQQEKRLLELDERGETIAAVHMARKLYGYDLSQATKFVKELKSKVTGKGNFAGG